MKKIQNYIFDIFDHFVRDQIPNKMIENIENITLDFFHRKKYFGTKICFFLKTYIFSKILTKYGPLTPKTPKVTTKSRFRFFTIFAFFYFQESEILVPSTARSLLRNGSPEAKLVHF